MIDHQTLKAIKPLSFSYYAYKFFVFHLKLTLAWLNDWKDRKDPTAIPVPPARLRHRVHGSLDKESFLLVGKTLANNIHNLCKIVDRDIYSFHQVLDFGCGSGRVIRNFQDAPSSCQLYGTDIDSELVRWCEKNLPLIRWSVNGFHPPLSYADNSFDLIYAISVFTHLDEKFQHAWLKELHRIAMPTAIIILSVHGEYCIKTLSPAIQSQIHSNGFMFVTGATGKLKLDKLPDFYQTAFHTKGYIYREWTKYFEVAHYVDRGINNHQDAVILRKR
jgi:SAM-dependent methyltransferase